MIEFSQVDNLMQQLVGNENKRHSSQTIKEMFDIHNKLFDTKEFGTSCGGCRQRVYNRLKDYWLNSGGKKIT